MATGSKQAIKVGIFVVVVATLMLLALAVIGGLRFWRPVDTYYVLSTETVAGIEIDSKVTLRGVTIGKVHAVELDTTNFSQVWIDLEIDPAVELPAGAKAYFERVGLTGERAIDIRGGVASGPRLSPGSTLPRGQTDLERLQARADELSEELSTLITDLTETVDDAAALVAAVDPERITAIVEAVDPERVATILTEAERATTTIASTSVQLRRGVGEARVDIQKVTADVDEVAATAKRTLEDADSAARALAGMIADGQTIMNARAEDLRVALDNLRRASADAKVLMERLRERPSLLLKDEKPKTKREAKRQRR